MFLDFLNKFITFAPVTINLIYIYHFPKRREPVCEDRFPFLFFEFSSLLGS